MEFSFESMEEAGRYFGRKEISRIFQSERPVHGCDIGVKVLALRSDYSKDTAGRRPLPGTTGPRSCPPGARPGAEGRTAEEPWGERTNRAAKPATTSH